MQIHKSKLIFSGLLTASHHRSGHSSSLAARSFIRISEQPLRKASPLHRLSSALRSAALYSIDRPPPSSFRARAAGLDLRHVKRSPQQIRPLLRLLSSTATRAPPPWLLSSRASPLLSLASSSAPHPCAPFSGSPRRLSPFLSTAADLTTPSRRSQAPHPPASLTTTASRPPPLLQQQPPEAPLLSTAEHLKASSSAATPSSTAIGQQFFSQPRILSPSPIYCFPRCL